MLCERSLSLAFPRPAIDIVSSQLRALVTTNHRTTAAVWCGVVFSSFRAAAMDLDGYHSSMYSIVTVYRDYSVLARLEAAGGAAQHYNHLLSLGDK